MFKEIKATELSIKRRSLLYGVGVNDSWYMTQRRVDGKPNACKIYTTWKNMIKRCSAYVSERDKEFYLDCSVCNDWLSFDNFYVWTKSQDWKGKQLDKDLLVYGNKLYSPDMCVYIDQKINKIICNSAAVRGEFPQGVDLTPWGFRAKISINAKHIHLGYFDTPKEAYIVYSERKLKYINDSCKLISDQRVIDSIIDYGTKMVKDAYAS